MDGRLVTGTGLTEDFVPWLGGRVAVLSSVYTPRRSD